MRYGLVLLLVAGCGGPSVVPGETLLDSGDATLIVRSQPFSFELRRGGVTIVQSAAPAIQLGALPQANPRYYPDPLTDDVAVYRRGERVTAVSRDGARTRFTVATSDPQRPVELAVTPEGEGSFAVGIQVLRPEPELVHVRLRLAAGAGERYFGLGEYFDSADHRGRRRDVRFVLDGTIESGYNEAHVPVPAFVSTAGWGLYLDHREPLAADFAKGTPEVELTLVAGALSGHLFAAANPVAATARLQRFAGLPPLWPPWVFAPQQWRNEHPVTCTVPCEQGCQASRTGADLVLEDAQAMRKLRLPGSVMWIDAPWMSAFNDFKFNPIQFPDAAGLIRKLNALGYQVVTWAAPFINQSDDRREQCGMLPPPAGGLFDEAKQKGYFVRAANGQPVLFPWRGAQGAMIDFTNPGAFAFWKSLVKRTTDLGVRGYKLDWDEYVLAAIGSQRPDFLFADGSTAATQHATLHELFHQAHHEALVEAGGPGFVIARSGTAGDAKYATAVWPGDLCNNFLPHRATPRPGIEGDKPHAGGLPAAIHGAISLAASAHPHYGSDIGGFRHGAPGKELLGRWIEFGALSTIMQLGGGGEHHNPWDFKNTGYDQELLDLYRKYARLHTSLFPYLYAYAKRNSTDGTPILRAPALVHPDDQAVAAAPLQYYFGEELLVAPVAEAGARQREVVLPAGRFVDYWTDQVHVGPGKMTFPASLDTLPLFVRAGAILPLLPDDVDTLAAATDPGVVTADARAGELDLRIYPEGQRRFVLADGTELGSEATAQGLVLTVAQPPRERRYTARILYSLLGRGAPKGIRRQGGPLPQYATVIGFQAAAEGAYYDPQSGLLFLRWKGNGERITVE